MFSFLTSLPLPPLRYALLGLLLVTTGWSAQSGGPRKDLADSTRTKSPPAFPDPDQVSPDESPPATQEQPGPRIRKLADGTTLMTITWDTVVGDAVTQHSAELVFTTPPVPEPSYPFLSACAGCVVLLHRRRTQPGKLPPARVDLANLPLERLTSQCSAVAPRRRRPGPPHRLVARRMSGHAGLRPRLST